MERPAFGLGGQRSVAARNWPNFSQDEALVTMTNNVLRVRDSAQPHHLSAFITPPPCGRQCFPETESFAVMITIPEAAEG